MDQHVVEPHRQMPQAEPPSTDAHLAPTDQPDPYQSGKQLLARMRQYLLDDSTTL